MVFVFRLQTVATVTVGSVSVMKVGSETPASCRKSANCLPRRAKRSAKTHRGWSAPTEVLQPHSHVNDES